MPIDNINDITTIEEWVAVSNQLVDSVNTLGGGASTAPTANTIPLADGLGKIDIGWIDQTLITQLGSSVAGNITFSNDIIISGNLTVNGTTTTISTENTTIEDNIIVLNNGENGPGVTLGTAGLEIDRGDGVTAGQIPARILFNETTDSWSVNDLTTPTTLYKVWHEGNDGSGSTLDADTVDGNEATALLDRSNHTGSQALGTITGHDKAAHDLLGIDAATVGLDSPAVLKDRSNHTGSQALGTITGHDKAAHDSLNIDADTVDGIEGANIIIDTTNQTIGGIKTFTGIFTKVNTLLAEDVRIEIINPSKGIQVYPPSLPESADFPWRDLHATESYWDLSPGGGGGNAPTFQQFRDNIWGYAYQVNDESWFNYHLPHDYLQNSDIYIHIHWSHKSGDSTGASTGATFTIDHMYARGHNQQVYPAQKTITTTIDGNNNQYRHFLTETQLSDAGGTGNLMVSNSLEPDGIIKIRLAVASNGLDGTNTDIFIDHVDIHYQTTNIGTLNRSPNFYS